MELDAISPQNILALLVQNVAHDLSLWIHSQIDLGAMGAPPEAKPLVVQSRPLQPAVAHRTAPQTRSQSPATATARIAPQTQAQRPATATARTAPQTQAQSPATTQARTQPQSQAQSPATAPARTQPRKSMINTFKAVKSVRDGVGLSVEDRRLKLNTFRARMQSCTSCSFHAQRRCVMNSTGDVSPRIMFISFGAQYSDAKTGSFLTHDDNELFKKWMNQLVAQGFDIKPSDIYTTHLIKCFYEVKKRTEGDTIKQCLPHLREEIKIVQPKVIVAFGGIVYEALFSTSANIALVRGEFKKFNDIPLIATHHPAEIRLKYLKNDPEHQREAKLLEERVLGDLKLAIEESRR